MPAAAIEEFLRSRLGSKGREMVIEPDQSLFELGVLDSLAFFQLIQFVEEQFHFSIEPSQVVPENFETLERITGFVRQKRGTGS
ncbi:MAG: acyl carrier protein [Gemmatimonadota bacterium]